MQEKQINTLLVEDDPDLNEVVVALLELGGCKVTSMFSPEDALRHLEDESDYELLVTDYRFPSVLTGTQLASQVQERIPGIKVIVSTGFDLDMIQKTQDQEYHLLNKPFRLEQIQTLLQKIFGNTSIN